jgi:hypothetical protein
MSEEYSSHTLLVEKFKSDYLLQKFYYRHSDIDIYVNIIITELLNYNLLLSEEAKNFLQENFVNNYKYWIFNMFHNKYSFSLLHFKANIFFYL